jgi:hypothetical protein
LIDEELADLFSVPLMGAQLRNFFINNDIRTMAQLLAMKPDELLELRHFGRGMLLLLERALAPRGLRLGKPPPPADVG